MEQYIEYLRKSQMDRDFEELSVEETLKRHRNILAEFTKSKRLNVTVILEEVVSGESLASRPQMMKCLELVNTGQYAGIVCMDIDRLSRGSSLDSGYIMQVLKLNGCKIITPQKTYDLDIESDEQFTDMKFMFSRFEHRTITKRLTAGRNMSVSEGKFLGSVSPIGYERYKLPGVKGYSLKIVPDEAEIVRMIFDMYVNNEVGCKAIAEELNRLGIPTKAKNKWSEIGVRHVLTNPVYVGKIRWNNFKTVRTMQDGKIIKKRKRSEEAELYDGLHEPIISEEIFSKASIARKERTVTPVRFDTEVKTPFARLLYCENCKSVISRKIPSQAQAGSRKPWYYCSGKCGCRITYCETLDNKIVDEMKIWLKNYIINLEKPEEKDTTSTALNIIQKQIKSLQEQQEKICNLLETGVYTVELFAKRNSALTEELTQLKKKEAELQKEVKVEMKKEEFIPMAQNLLDSYDKLTAKEKNMVWKQLLEKVTYYRKPGAAQDDFEIHIYPRIPTK